MKKLLKNDRKGVLEQRMSKLSMLQAQKVKVNKYQDVVVMITLSNQKVRDVYLGEQFRL